VSHVLPTTNEDKNELDKIIGKLDRKVESLLNLQNTFKIEINEGTFYVLKELGDGNYLVMDKSSRVYGLIHDPYEVDKIFENKDDFISALSTKKFNIDDYCSSKFH